MIRPAEVSVDRSGPGSGPLIEIEGLSAGYAGVPVVHDLDLTVEPGEVVALLGPNGAGKTTTLLTISGLLTPLAGTIHVLGARPRRRRPELVARNGLAHVPEDRGIFFGLTTAENLRLGASAKERRASVALALEHFPELAPLLRRRAGLLSGGEQQMLALGRALASRPRVLMVDEMSLGLAPVIVQRLLPVIHQIAQTEGIGVLLVEQHVQLALRYADRGYILSRGRVVAHGTAGELADSPDLLRVSYLGEAAAG